MKDISTKPGEVESKAGEQLPAGHLAESRLPALDGVRGLAVLMILVFHYIQGMVPCPWLSRLIRPLLISQTGIDLFFVLSGFLITGILLNAKGSPHFLRNFYARRAVRILPLYYLVVCGFLVTGWISYGFHESLSKVWWYFAYLQNVGLTFWPASIGQPGWFWSLGVEEHFYIFWPLLVLFCQERHLPRVLCGFIIGCVGFRLLLLFHGYPVFNFSPCRLDALSAGAMLAVLVRQPELAEWVHSACRWVVLLLGPVLVVLYYLFSGRAEFFMQAIKYTLVAIAYAALLGAAVGPGRWRWLEQLLTLSGLRWMGKYSYAMYVFHPIIYGLIMNFMRARISLVKTFPAAYMAIESTVLLTVVCLASWISWQLFEKHFLKLKRFFEYSISHESARIVSKASGEC